MKFSVPLVFSMLLLLGCKPSANDVAACGKLTSDSLIERTNAALRTSNIKVGGKLAADYERTFKTKEFSFNEASNLWLVPFDVIGDGAVVAEMYGNVACPEGVEFSIDTARK